MSTDIVGRWKVIQRGLDLASMYDVSPGTQEQLVLRRSGIAEMLFGGQNAAKGLAYQPTWEIDGDKLVIMVPVAPMQDVGIDEWTFDPIPFSIVELDGDRLILDTRPHGGEVITVYRRVKD